MTTPAKLISSSGAGVGSGVGAAAVAATWASVSAGAAVGAGGCVGATTNGSGSMQAKAARATSRVSSTEIPSDRQTPADSVMALSITSLPHPFLVGLVVLAYTEHKMPTLTIETVRANAAHCQSGCPQLLPIYQFHAR